MKLYKLTDGNNQTKNDTQWGENVTHAADGDSTELCNEHWLHAYAAVAYAAKAGKIDLVKLVHAAMNGGK